MNRCESPAEAFERGSRFCVRRCSGPAGWAAQVAESCVGQEGNRLHNVVQRLHALSGRASSVTGG